LIVIVKDNDRLTLSTDWLAHVCFSARRYASAEYAVAVWPSVCPSVCPSVTSRKLYQKC